MLAGFSESSTITQSCQFISLLNFKLLKPHAIVQQQYEIAKTVREHASIELRWSGRGKMTRHKQQVTHAGKIGENGIRKTTILISISMIVTALNLTHISTEFCYTNHIFFISIMHYLSVNYLKGDALWSRATCSTIQLLSDSSIRFI